MANGFDWMKDAELLTYLRHFVQLSRLSGREKIPLVLDNYVSHLRILGIDYCTENHVILLVLQSHALHKIQRLDRMVF